ncbi:MAG: HAMP domain-containing histidine kinase [Pseudomonadota bacterium]|nr:HAMP domain-containing histidine kinase [Pseudomonadota bacterium]
MRIDTLAKSFDGFLDYFIPMEIRVRPDSHRRARMFMLSHVFGPFLGNVIPLYLYIVGQELDYRLWVFAASITAFWVYPFVLKWTQAYDVIAFVSVQNLLFCIFWACYSYGGIYSPFLPWLLITPILAFFYLPSNGRIRDGLLLLITANVTAFGALVLSGFQFPPVDLELFQIIGIISTISASTYVAMMSLYFARVLKEQQRFEREVGEFLATSESLQSITAAAQQASAAKADFVASMSHELRTPLNAVIGYSQLLLDGALDDGDEAIARDLESINGAGTHLLKLVNDILDYSKIDVGKLEVNSTPDNLRQQLAELGRLAGPALEGRDYSYECDLSQADFVVTTDWNAFGKGVNHILLGAASSPSGGKLRLTASRSANGFCLIQITDPAGAMDGRPTDSLFDIFTDDRDVTPTKYGGAGIGLALGLKFVRVLGGDITASQAASGARTFTISIPLEAAPAPELALAG